MIGRIFIIKSALIYIILPLLIVSCDKSNEEIGEDDLLIDGHYGGNFSYNGSNYWYLLEINQNNYEEWPSGGVMYQKSYGCLTTGTYSIDRNIITFEIDSFKFSGFPEPCITDMLLPGTYTITSPEIQDSLIFERGIGDNHIIYYLKKPSLNE